MRFAEIGEFGVARYDLTVEKPAAVSGREPIRPEGTVIQFRQYELTNRSRLAGVRTLNVGHDTPRDHHSTRHGNRKG